MEELRVVRSNPAREYVGWQPKKMLITIKIMVYLGTYVLKLRIYIMFFTFTWQIILVS
jgi:hypothetical protein